MIYLKKKVGLNRKTWYSEQYILSKHNKYNPVIYTSIGFVVAYTPPNKVLILGFIFYIILAVR